MALKPPEPRISSGTPLSTVDRYLERALHLFDKKKYDEALLDLDEALRLQRKNGELHATRAYILICADRPEDALKSIDTALQLDPRQWLAHYCRAMIAFAKKDYNSVLVHCTAAQWIAPLRPEIYIYRAAVYFQQGNKAAAKKEIDAALQTMQPGDKRLRDARKWAKAIKNM